MLVYPLWPAILAFAPRCAVDVFGSFYHSEDPLNRNRLGKSFAHSVIFKVVLHCCIHLSFLLKCEKESNNLSCSCIRESMWPRQALLSQQGYLTQNFFKQRLSQGTALSQFFLGFFLGFFLLYIPAGPLKVKWKNINSTTISQILFPFCGLDKIIWKKPLSTLPSTINAHSTLELCHMKILAVVASQIVRENSFPLMLR